MYLTLNEIKKHLNIDDSYHDDDTYLLSLGEAAEAMVETHIDNELVNFEDENHNLPNALKLAILMLIATWYASRESVTFANCGVLPHGYEYIINLFQTYFKEVEV